MMYPSIGRAVRRPEKWQRNAGSCWNINKAQWRKQGSRRCFLFKKPPPTAWLQRWSNGVKLLHYCYGYQALKWKREKKKKKKTVFWFKIQICSSVLSYTFYCWPGQSHLGIVQKISHQMSSLDYSAAQNGSIWPALLPAYHDEFIIWYYWSIWYYSPTQLQ